MERTSIWCLVPLVCAALTPTCLAATISGDLTVNLVFPSPLPGTLSGPTQFGSPVLSCGQSSTGDAGVTSCVNPTEAYNPATRTFAITAGPIAAFAGPAFGRAQAVSEDTSSSEFLLNNLTATPLTVSFGGSYTYDVNVTPSQDFTGNLFWFVIVYGSFGGGTLVLANDEYFSNPLHSATVPIDFTVALPPGQSAIGLGVGVGGQVGPTPEPSVILTVGAGLLTLICMRLRRLKEF